MNPRIIEVLSTLSGLAGRVKCDRVTCGLNSQIDALLPGTGLIVRRRAYLHHGIYVGDGRVIHYAGWFHSALGLVEEVTIKQFTEGRRYSIGRTPANPEEGEQVVRRARSRLGERCYHLLKNNCEHFCNWCQLGEWRSGQVEALARPTLLLFGLLQSLRGELLARLFRFRDDVLKVAWVTARTGKIMKTAALVMLFMVGGSRVGTGIAAPLSDLATASLWNTHATKGFGGFALRGDGADYRLGSRVGLFVDYQEMRPANGVFSSLQTGLPAMPPVRLGGVMVLGGIRVYLR